MPHAKCNNNQVDTYGLSLWQATVKVQLHQVQTERPMAANPQSNQVNQLGLSPPLGCYHPQPPLPFIITHPKADTPSFYRPTEGGRLSQPRHCSKDVQSMSKAVQYIAVGVVINTTAHGEIRTWVLSYSCDAMLPLDYSNLQSNYSKL